MIHFPIRTPAGAFLTVGEVSEVEWSTGPKQRPNQWACPPFMMLEKVLPSRYAIGLDPTTCKSTNKVLALIALDAERLGRSNPDFMIDVGDN